MRLRTASLIFLTAILASGAAIVCAEEEPLLVFAAASLGGPLDSLAADYMEKTRTPILIAYGSSGSLAQQIRIGADVDLFISADTGWVMRLVADKNSPVLHWEPFLGNRLLLVTSNELDHRMRAFGPLDGPTIGKIAIADPDAAPAGRYARAYLQRIGIYDRVRSKLVILEDVRGVVNAVRLGVADVGFVYASDVAQSGDVRGVEFPPDSLYPPIVYGLAIMKGGRSDAAARFAQFLQAPAAQSLFARAGFVVDTSTTRH